MLLFWCGRTGEIFARRVFFSTACPLNRRCINEIGCEAYHRTRAAYLIAAVNERRAPCQHTRTRQRGTGLGESEVGSLRCTFVAETLLDR